MALYSCSYFSNLFRSVHPYIQPHNYTGIHWRYPNKRQHEAWTWRALINIWNVLNVTENSKNKITVKKTPKTKQKQTHTYTPTPYTPHTHTHTSTHPHPHTHTHTHPHPHPHTHPNKTKQKTLQSRFKILERIRWEGYFKLNIAISHQYNMYHWSLHATGTNVFFAKQKQKKIRFFGQRALKKFFELFWSKLWQFR